MPYALNNPQDGQPPSYRAIRSAADAATGEVVVTTDPTPDLVWDAANQRLRARTPAETQQQQQNLQQQQTNLGGAVNALKNSAAADTKALVAVLQARGLL